MWSRKHLECVNCHDTTHRHHANGSCIRCWSKFRPKHPNPPTYSPTQDGRRKLLPEEYPLVRATYKELMSYQKTADHYNISKRLVIFIVNPEKYEQFKLRNKQQAHHKKYYDKEKWRLYMRKYRAKKRKLFKKKSL